MCRYVSAKLMVKLTSYIIKKTYSFTEYSNKVLDYI